MTRAEIAEALAVVSRRASVGAPTHGATQAWAEEVVGMLGGWEALMRGLRAGATEAAEYRSMFLLFAEWRAGVAPECDSEGQTRAKWVSEQVRARIQGEAEKWLTRETK